VNREQKAAVIDQVAADIESSEAVFAVDYRGLSVPQAAELRTKLAEADATLRVVKNTLTERAADKSEGAAALKDVLEGPTALLFVRGDVASAAKTISTFKKANEVPSFKGGTMGGKPLSVDELEALAKLPTREVLQGQFVGVLASPLTGLVRGLGSLIGGLAIQLGAIRDQGLVSGEAPAAPAEAPPEVEAEAPAAEPAPADGDSEEGTGDSAEPAAEAPAATEEEPSEAPGDPVAEAEKAEETETETPSEGDAETEDKEG
jgi:large subunit ribosomal protein L10